MDGEVLYFATLPPCKVLPFVVHVWVCTPGSVRSTCSGRVPPSQSLPPPAARPPTRQRPLGKVVICDPVPFTLRALYTHKMR